jgi:hypothetical protein
MRKFMKDDFSYLLKHYENFVSVPDSPRTKDLNRNKINLIYDI